MVTGDHMAKILAFRSGESKRDEGSGRARKRRSAEVILFPGVRYERWNELEGREQSDVSKTRDLSRQRDVLELAD